MEHTSLETCALNAIIHSLVDGTFMLLHPRQITETIFVHKKKQVFNVAGRLSEHDRFMFCDLVSEGQTRLHPEIGKFLQGCKFSYSLNCTEKFYDDGSGHRDHHLVYMSSCTLKAYNKKAKFIKICDFDLLGVAENSIKEKIIWGTGLGIGVGTEIAAMFEVFNENKPTFIRKAFDESVYKHNPFRLCSGNEKEFNVAGGKIYQSFMMSRYAEELKGNYIRLFTKDFLS